MQKAVGVECNKKFHAQYVKETAESNGNKEGGEYNYSSSIPPSM